jgi:hypothetical protein
MAAAVWSVIKDLVRRSDSEMNIGTQGANFMAAVVFLLDFQRFMPVVESVFGVLWMRP